MKIAKVEDLSFFNFPGVEQKRKRTPALEAIICYEDILYYSRTVCHYYREVRNKDHSPSWQFSCPFSLVSNPKWRLREEDLLENPIHPCHTAAILSRETKRALFYHAKPRNGNHGDEA